jgi:hypothetical protein
MRAIAALARASAALPKEEATLSRELGTSLLPATHVPVGYGRQNGRCCQFVHPPQHSYSGDLVSHRDEKRIVEGAWSAPALPGLPIDRLPCSYQRQAFVSWVSVMKRWSAASSPASA